MTLEKAGQARALELRGRTGFAGKMTASGWKTAPPQVYTEAACATDSACRPSFEASCRGTHRPLSRQAYRRSGAACAQFAPPFGRVLRFSVHPQLPPSAAHLSAPPGEWHLAVR